MGRQGVRQSCQKILSKEETATEAERISNLVESHLPLVVSLVDRVWVSSRLGITRDDLLSAGTYGLIMAARKFDPSRGIAFGVFARSHIRGALLREINQAKQSLGPTTDDFMSLVDGEIDPDTIPDASNRTQLDEVEIAEVKNLMEYLLTPEEKLALTLYYYEELTLEEIGAVTGETSNAVGRRIRSALEKLRVAILERRK